MSKTLAAVSNDIAAVVTVVSPHIVRVDARKRLPATGVVLGNGLIATASHVVRRDKVKLGLNDGSTVEAKLIGRDQTTDIAILKTEATLAKFPIAADVGQVGHLILALGRPGNTVQATLGIISALGDAWRTGAGGTIDRYVQTDVVMYPGFSGGPLVNAAGEMIGLNSSALARGVSLTIPASTVKRVAESIAEHGHVKRGFLGVSTQTVRVPDNMREELKQKSGLLLVAVESGSPADDAGLVLGDTIVAFGKHKVRNHDDLLAQMSGDRIGKKSRLSVIRGGKLETISVVLGAKAS